MKLFLLQTFGDSESVRICSFLLFLRIQPRLQPLVERCLAHPRPQLDLFRGVELEQEEVLLATHARDADVDGGELALHRRGEVEVQDELLERGALDFSRAWRPWTAADACTCSRTPAAGRPAPRPSRTSQAAPPDRPGR